MNYDDSSAEAKEYELGKLGEEEVQKRSFTERVEEEITRTFAMVLKSCKLSTFFASLIMVSSFLQIIGIAYASHMRLDSDDRYQNLLSTALNHLRIYAVIAGTESQVWYFVIGHALTVCEVVLILVLMLVWLQAGRQHTFFSSLAGTLCAMHFWVFTTPTLEFAVQSFTCSKYFSTCWSQTQTINAVVYGFALLIHFCLTFLISLFGNDANPYNEVSNPFVRFGTNFELFFTALRAVLALCLHILSGTGYLWVFNVLLMMLAFVCTYYCMRFMPYYNGTVSRVFMACVIATSWATLCIVVADALYQAGSNNSANTILVVLGLVFSYPLASAYQRKRKEDLIMTTAQPHLLDEPTFDIYISTLINLIYKAGKETLSVDSHIALNGYMLSQYTDNPNLGIVAMANDFFGVGGAALHASSELVGVARSFRPNMTNVVQHLREEGLGKLPSILFTERISGTHKFRAGSVHTMHEYIPKRVCVAYAYFIMEKLKNYHAAAMQFDAAGLGEGSIAMRFATYVGKMRIAETEEESNRKKVAMDRKRFLYLDPRRVLEYEARFGRFKSELINITTLQRMIWGELLSPVPNMNKVYQAGLEMEKSGHDVQLQLQELQKLNRRNPVTERIYGSYLNDILCLHEEAETHLRVGRQAERSEDADDLGGKDDTKYFLNDDTVVITISAMPDSMGRIIKASNGILKLFEYSPYDLIGHDVNILMPYFIAATHKTFIENYLASGVPRILGQPIETLAADKEQYLFKVQLYVRQFYDMRHGSIFVGLLHLVAQDQALLVTNEYGRLLGISASAAQELGGLPPSLFKENFVYIFYIWPSMVIDKSKDLVAEYMGIDGNTTISFSVPKNLIGVAQSIRNEQLDYGMGKKEESEAVNIPAAVAARTSKLSKFNRAGSVRDLKGSRFFAMLNYNDATSVQKSCKIRRISYGESGLITLKEITFRRAQEVVDRESSPRNGEKDYESRFIDQPPSPKKKKRSSEDTDQWKGALENGERRPSLSPYLVGQAENSPLVFRGYTVNPHNKTRESLPPLKPAESEKHPVSTGLNTPTQKKKKKIKPRKHGKKSPPDVSPNKAEKKPADSESESQDSTDKRLKKARQCSPGHEKSLGSNKRIPERANNKTFDVAKDDDKSSLAAFVRVSLVKELAGLRNVSYTQYYPSCVQRLSWGLMLTYLVGITCAIAQYVLNARIHSEITSVDDILSKARILPYIQIYQDTLSLELMNPNYTGGAMLNETLRNSYYNYANIDYEGQYSYLNYSAWKRLELYNEAENLQRTDAELLLKVRSFYSQTHVDEVNPTNVSAHFSQFTNQKSTDYMQLYSALSLYTDQAVVLYNGLASTSYIDPNSASAKYIVENAFQELFQYTMVAPTTILADEGRHILTVINYVSIGFSCGIALLSVACVALLLPVLFRIKDAQIMTLQLITEINQESIRKQINNCTMFLNFVQLNTFHSTHRDVILDNDSSREATGSEQEQEEDTASLNDSKTPEGKKHSKRDDDSSSSPTTREHRRRSRLQKQREFAGDTCKHLLKFMIPVVIFNVYFTITCIYPRSLYRNINQHMDEFTMLYKQINNNAIVYSLMLNLLANKGRAYVLGVPVAKYIASFCTNLVYEQKNIMTHRSEYHSYYSNKYEGIYQSVMRENTCTALTGINATECAELQAGGLTKGLYYSNMAFTKNLVDILELFIEHSSSASIAAYSKELMNGDTMISSEVLYRKYYYLGYLTVIHAIDDSIESAINEAEPVLYCVFGIFVLFLLMSLVAQRTCYINVLLQDLFSSKAMLTTIPVDIILNSPRLRSYIMECSTDIMGDVSA